MDQSHVIKPQFLPPPPPRPSTTTLEQSMRELTLHDGRRPDLEPSSSPESMDLDDGAADKMPYSRHAMAAAPAIAPPPPQLGVVAPELKVRSLEDILRELLPEGSVFEEYTPSGYIFT
ncbi:hypothetical protein ACP70R_031445 [Stipagrostis hirtigluma subsp. patula]